MRAHMRHRRLYVALALLLSLVLAAGASAYWLLAGLPSLDGSTGSRG
jgi:hypothetical protein